MPTTLVIESVLVEASSPAQDPAGLLMHMNNPPEDLSEDQKEIRKCECGL